LSVSDILVRASYGLEESVRYGRMKGFFHDLLENPRSWMCPYFDLFMISLVLSSITVMLYSVRTDLGSFDDLFEQSAVTVFILEYLLRLWIYNDIHKVIIEHYERAEFVNRPFRIGLALKEVLANKWEYMTCPLAIIDLLAILPSYRAIRLLRLFLLFRLFKLFRYARSLGRFVDVLSEKRYELLTLAIFMAFVVFAAASALYVFEVDDPRSEIHDFFGSLYWALVTLSTVGYGDITPQTTPGRLITMVLIVAGIGVISFFTSIIVSAFAEKLPEVSAQRVFSDLERYPKHTILCGYGRVGQVVAQRLARNKQRFVVIDPDEVHVRLAKHRGYLAVQGNAEDNELLESTNIRQARRILCLTGEDVVNAYITLSARQLNPQIEIISRANHRDNEIKLHRAGASYTVAPFDTAGLVAAQYVGQPVGGLRGHIRPADRRGERGHGRGARAAGCGARRPGRRRDRLSRLPVDPVRCGQRRHTGLGFRTALLYPQGAAFLLQSGPRVSAQGQRSAHRIRTRAQRDTLQRELLAQRDLAMERKPIVIFGRGRQAMSVAERLRGRAQDMLVVTSDESEVSLAQSKGFSVVQIDYTDDEALRSIGIGRWVSTVFCMFPEESQNVFLTISARALDPGLKIVSITESRAAGQKLLAAGATKIIDPYEITGNKIHELIRHPLVVETLEHTVLGQANLDLAEIEVEVGSPLAGRRLSALDVGRHFNLILLGMVDLELSNRLTFRTLGLDHRLDVGDMLVVIGPREEIEQFRGALREDECDSGAGHA